jgi:predicted amidohydrolase YtcJ
MGIDKEGLEIYRRLESSGSLPIRIFAYLSHDPVLMKAELAKPRKRELGFFQVQGVKFYLDGALGSRGARLLAPYSDAPGQQGLWVTQPSLVRIAVGQTLRAGYQPAIHAIGDAANRAALDLLKGLPKGSLKPRIEHAQIVEATDAQRFGTLGAIASVQPIHCASDHPWTPARLGPARIKEAYPWRTMLQGGALLALGTDAPNDDLNPYAGLAAAETRQDAEDQPSGGFLPEQRLTREEALRGFTWANGRALGAQGLGVLRSGAVADLLWVEADLSKINTPTLRKLRPGRLWVNGLEVKLNP